MPLAGAAVPQIGLTLMPKGRGLSALWQEGFIWVTSSWHKQQPPTASLEDVLKLALLSAAP